MNMEGEMICEPTYGLPSVSLGWGISTGLSRGFVIEELARVKANKKWNYINTSVELACPGYINAEDFQVVE